jgi:hypothetical protein
VPASTPPNGPEAVATAPQHGLGVVCGACGKPLTGRQRVACSDRCRFQVWQRRQQAAQARRDEAVRLLALEVSRLAAEMIRQVGRKQLSRRGTRRGVLTIVPTNV